MVPAHDEHTMDTRTPSPRPPPQDSNDNADYQPDLSQEVSLLSTKLINAINYQTNLDDSLQHARHELEAVNRDNARLRAEKKSLDDAIANGLFVRRNVMDKTVRELRAELAKERAAREEAEKARKQTDAELENLTTALFEEANTMVAAARKDTEAVERRNSQLRGQIVDTELLLASQQEQLQDLKLTMGRMSERGDNDTTAGRDSIPSTPIGSSAAMFDAMSLSPNAANIADIPPEHPLYFSQLLTPVLRSDIPAYLDFQDLLQSARKAMSHSRAPSGNNSAGLSSSSQTNIASSSSPSLPGAFSFSTNSSPQSATFANTGPPLKDSKFYKRSLVEDIEPTLRLDLAPGLSFLSRRTVLSSLLQGSMVVEPFMPQTKFYGPIFACALCGEQRKAEPYVRKHRFRTSEEESAQRYPLCDYCLGRTRAAGDFVGFLRMVRDGHWRAESDEEQKGAWEEAVRLRERMFWARQGGGVVPSLAKQGTPSTAHVKSARPSLESIAEQESPAQKASQAVQAAQTETTRDVEQVSGSYSNSREIAEKPAPDEKLLGVFKSHRQSMSLGGNLVQPNAGSATTNATPLVVEPQQLASEPESSEQDVEVNDQAFEPDAAAPISQEMEVQDQVATELQDSIVEPVAEVNSSAAAASQDRESELASMPDETANVVEQSPAIQLATEMAETVSADENEIVQPTITSDPTASEDVKEPEGAPIDPVTENQGDKSNTVIEDMPIPVDDTPAPQTPIETPSTLEAPARPTERRGSSVMARVRAMESPKPPGSFD